MAGQKGHDMDERTPEDIEREVSERDPLAGPAQLAQALTDETTTREKHTTAEDVPDAIRAFARAAIEVALDCTPGEPDDYLYEYGVLATETNTLDQREIIVTTDQGRRYAVSVTVRDMDAPDPEQCGAPGCPARAWSNGWCMQHQPPSTAPTF